MDRNYKPLTRARADAVAELNYARAYNYGLEAAARVAERAPTIAEAIRKLALPLRSKGVEAIFSRRDKLASKRSRSVSEENELTRLRLAIERLPTGHSPADQICMDLIHEAARLITKHRLTKPARRRKVS